MFVTLFVLLALAPLVLTISLVIIGRPVYNSLKLLVILLPFQAFGAIEAGFTIPPVYLLLVLIIVGIVLKGELLSLKSTGSKAIIFYCAVALLASFVAFVQGGVGSDFISENMRYRAGELRSVIQYALLIFHFALFYIIITYIRDQVKMNSLLKIHLYTGFGLFCLGIVQMFAFVLDLPMKDITWSVELINKSSTIQYGAVRYYEAGVADFSTRTTFIESLHFADYLNSVLPIGLAFWISRSKSIKEKFGFIATPWFALTGIVAMFFTFSRSGWGALALSIVVLMIWLSPKAALIRLSIGTVTLAAVTIVMTHLGFFSSTVGSFWDAITGRFQFEQILLGPRAEYFLVLYDSVSNHPWLGLGAGNFALAGAAATGSDQVHSAHGIIWAALADYGIIGCLMLITFLGGILYQLGRTIKALPNHSSARIVGVGIFASLTALYFQSLFVGDRIQFYLILLLALAAVLINLNRGKELVTEVQLSWANRATSQYPDKR